MRPTSASPPTPPRRVVVLGPTASGKSDVAMAAARAVAGTEIVAVDAMQVYRRMDIGTAKPTAADRAAITHHCLDLVEPSERFTVADYQRAHVEAINSIGARDGARELLVAGTGLYLTAVIDDLELPGEWPEIRAELEGRLDAAGREGPETAATELAGMYHRLRELDADAAAKIEPTNPRRIVRALEVCLGSGRPFSSYGPGIARFPDHPGERVEQIGLRWRRAALADRIETRVHHMMDAGLLAEVEALLAEPAGLSNTARQALGYKELFDHLQGTTGLETAVEQIVTRTRQFAVRQERWFRRDPRIRWVDIEDDAVGEAAPHVIAALAETTE